MGSERRSLENVRIFGIIGILLGIIGNISYYLRFKGINISFFYSINIESISIMMIFSIVTLGFFSINNLKLNLEHETLIKIKKKTIIFKIICILFAIYSILIAVIFKDLILIRVEILTEIILILTYIIERKIIVLKLTDRQLKWKRDYDYPGTYNKESNLFWRINIKFYPHMKVKWKDRVDRIKWLKILALILILSRNFEREFYIILIIFIPDIIYFFEAIFGLYTKTSGICTGIVETVKNSTNIPVYKVYITDYENEEEIAFKVKDYCYISERDEVVVVHSMIAKRVIEVQGIRMNFL